MKDGSLLSGDFQPGQLPAGAVGPVGPVGPAGPAGRSALEPMKPGETIRGRIGGDFHAATAGADWRAFVSFPVLPSSGPVGIFVDGVTAGETCTGTAGAPSAPAGYVCIYPVDAFNPVTGSGTHLVSANAFGFYVSWVAGSADDTYFMGNWAYTQA